jgi:hypothetical protein
MIDEWPLTNDEIDAMYHLPIIGQLQQSSVQDMAIAKHMERMRIVARRSFKSKFIHDRYLWGSLQ